MREKRKNLRKILSLLLAGAVCLNLTACGQDSVGPEQVKKDFGVNPPEEKKGKKNTDDFYQLVGDKAYEDGPASYYYRAQGKSFQVYDGENFQDMFLKGVNLGAGVPGHFPGELAITKSQYQAWFRQISEMNANCIRVYTIQSPEFYQALYEFNLSAKKPLYLFHGTWLEENLIKKKFDAFDKKLRQYLRQEEEDVIDVIHGNCTIEAREGHASGTYRYDVSKWVIGWILGMESEGDFVQATNKKHGELTSYEGKYFTCKDVTPFEVYWTETAEEITSYEMEHYGMQRPLSCTNWPTTDALDHPSETMKVEDMVSLNMEHVKPTGEFKCGSFAAYHIYSYYPNFMYTQKEYRDYKDKEGQANTYEAYLKDLKIIHTIPILVAEFGIPASRGLTHVNDVTGYNQGQTEEKDQGEKLSHMMEDIYQEDYAGGLVFSWEDEWFKRTWNTANFSNPNRRAYWSDVMTNEQHFGLMEFVPGDYRQTVTLDGHPGEWTGEDLFCKRDGMEMSIKEDCAYLYLMVKKKGTRWGREEVNIPFDITPKSGAKSYGKTKMSRPVDFVLKLRGMKKTELLVQKYYNRYNFEYSNYGDKYNFMPLLKAGEKNAAHFEKIRYLLEVALDLPDRDLTIPKKDYYGGEMTFGTTDYEKDDYNSLADFYYRGEILEIRIPWLLLNFRDPSSNLVEGDFWGEKSYQDLKVQKIYLGLGDAKAKKTKLKAYKPKTWNSYPYHERLRESYYILKETYEQVGKPKKD
ncbi:MAG: family 2 glycosyl transferase [Eubacterium sp.]|nr:family 2 glycosyl transferase [Eubacterium sp.]